MSKSELKEEKKKRKRQEDVAEDVPKVKKSKKSKDPTIDEAVVVPEKKEKKKDKKAKKSKKPSDDTTSEPVETSAPEANASTEENALQQDFIRFDDEPMPDAVNGTSNGTLSRKESKKSKKDKKDKTSKKSKDGSATEPPQADPASIAEDQPNGEETKDKKKLKKDKKAKKSREEASEAAPEQEKSMPETEDIDAAVVKAKKDKKEKKRSKKEKKTSETAEPDDNDEPPTETDNAEVNAEENDDQNAAAQNGETSGNRFIVFVGNLPYSATKDLIETHFEKLKPFEVRMRTYKASNKFMGTCFIEFERFDHMRTALKKYHHSVFPDGKKKEGRKINVELSAGGGGNNPERMQKIKAKNEKLSNERQRAREKRDEVESKQKERKEKKGGKHGKGSAEDADAAETETAAPAEENNGMHPARLAMMQRGPPKWQGHTRQRF